MKGQQRRSNALPAIKGNLAGASNRSREEIGGAKTEEEKEEGPPKLTDKELQKRKTVKLND